MILCQPVDFKYTNICNCHIQCSFILIRSNMILSHKINVIIEHCLYHIHVWCMYITLYIHTTYIKDEYGIGVKIRAKEKYVV